MQNSSGRGKTRALSFLSALCVLLLALSLVSASRAKAYRTQLLHTANQSLSQLCTELDTIRTSLQKSGYAQSGPMLTKLSAAVQNAAAGAKLTLSQLTTEENGAAPLFRFLSQVGDYTAALSRRVQSGKPLTQKQKEGLRALSAYAESLCAAANEIRAGLDDDTVCFFAPAATLPHQKAAASADFDAVFLAAGEKLTDYPALPYDGPSSDRRQKQMAKATEALDEISPQTARSRAAK
ncbi:MAG: germination protein YpeB, partial [Clostridia bacterium]|nr:germination protein YpeB [Clostridia bacterium]